MHEMSKPLFPDKLEKYFNKSSANKNLRRVLSICFHGEIRKTIHLIISLI